MTEQEMRIASFAPQLGLSQTRALTTPTATPLSTKPSMRGASVSPTQGASHLAILPRTHHGATRRVGAAITAPVWAKVIGTPQMEH